MTFTAVTPPRLLVGWKAATEGRLAAEVKRLGSRPLVVTGSSLVQNGTLAQILATLPDCVLHSGVPPEPDLVAAQAVMEVAKASDCDCVLCIGGGSALDVGKCAVLEGDIHDYFHAGKPVPEQSPLPLLAVPTTAGTGSEATWVSVLTDKTTTRKASIRGGAMMANTVLLDAALTVSCPPQVTAYSGMDAFVQAVESFTSSGANPYTRALAREATRLTGSSVERAYNDGTDRVAREEMLLGSYLAGVALNTSRLGLVHGIAHPVGAITGAAHGLLCGLLMPAVMHFNRFECYRHYDALAADLRVDDLLAFTENLLDTMAVPRHLSAVGFTAAQVPLILADTLASGSTKANPRAVSEADIIAVTEAAL